MIFVQKVDCSDDFVSLTKLCALLSVECPLKILNLSKFMKSCIVLVGFKAQQRDISLDFASFCMHLTVIIFVDFLDNPQRLECILCEISFILKFTKVHHDLSKIVSIGIFF